jgi:hypothetical protein
VLSLAHDAEARFFKRSNGMKMIDASKLGHGLECNFDFPDIRGLGGLGNGRQIFSDRNPHIFDGLFFRGPL